MKSNKRLIRSVITSIYLVNLTVFMFSYPTKIHRIGLGIQYFWSVHGNKDTLTWHLIHDKRIAQVGPSPIKQVSG